MFFSRCALGRKATSGAQRFCVQGTEEFVFIKWTTIGRDEAPEA